MEPLRKRRTKRSKKKTRSKRRDLTNNERLLLTILGLVIVFLLSFKYIIDPQLNKISSLKEDQQVYSLKIAENNRILKNKESIMEERDLLFKEKTEIEKDFFKSLDQPDIIYILNELLAESYIEMESLTFNRPFMEELNGQEIQKMDILMPFNGDFESLQEIILSLEEETRKLVINNINIQKNEETEIAGNISLGVYSLSGLVESDGDNLPIETTSDNDSNPFLPYDGYVDPKKLAEEKEREEREEEERASSLGGSSEDLEEEDEEKQDHSNHISKDPIDTDLYETYTAVKGDNVSYISFKKYGTVKYMDEILALNDMKRESILPIGKVLRLKKR